MRDCRPAPSVVVGVDGSRTAIQAAIWAVDEAVSRDLPLRLVYVIDAADLSPTEHFQFAAARTALYDAQHAVEAIGEPVKIETDVLPGKPVAKLAEESRSAVMVCVGSVGIEHACRGAGSVAAALPDLARCPVAVIRPSLDRTNPDPRSIVVEVDNGVVLRHAFEEARLREAPLWAVASWQAEAPGDSADGDRLARAQLNRRITLWRRLYPDVHIEPTVIRGGVCQYLAKNAQSVQLFVTGPRSRSCDTGKPGPVECSTLTVRGDQL
ncbi:universal stress protein [Mycobacterium xenopi]|uniref:universal stress protein n=1 Tax=Mycobacterium xenopi TaxID=1789 RepID=UPI0022EAE200|nr:universal stress protein [Mycobacterium xenopi]MDA3662202.1 universal stress protein [Mycobacterium xenopi]